MGAPAAALRILPLAQRQLWLDKVADWHHTEWLKGRSNATATEAQESLEKRRSLLAEHCNEQPLPQTFVAELNGKAVASASLVYYQFTEDQARSEWLTNVFVSFGYRRMGIGAAMVEHACDYARQHGVERLMLYTRDRSAFYLARGWEPCGMGRVQGQDVSILSRQLGAASSGVL